MIYISKPWLTNKSYIIKLMSTLITLVIHIKGWQMIMMIFQNGQHMCNFRWVKGVAELLTKFLTHLVGSRTADDGSVVVDEQFKVWYICFSYIVWWHASKGFEFKIAFLLDCLPYQGYQESSLFYYLTFNRQKEKKFKWSPSLEIY